MKISERLDLTELVEEFKEEEESTKEETVEVVNRVSLGSGAQICAGDDGIEEIEIAEGKENGKQTRYSRTITNYWI